MAEGPARLQSQNGQVQGRQDVVVAYAFCIARVPACLVAG